MAQYGPYADCPILADKARKADIRLATQSQSFLSARRFSKFGLAQIAISSGFHRSPAHRLRHFARKSIGACLVQTLRHRCLPHREPVA